MLTFVVRGISPIEQVFTYTYCLNDHPLKTIRLQDINAEGVTGPERTDERNGVREDVRNYNYASNIF